MKPDDKIILIESKKAAKYRTDIKGWVSRDGTFFGNGPHAENAAHYHGCTHVLCKRCGEPTPKEYLLCDACCDKADAERYAAMPRAKWDGKALLYSEVTDRFYNSPPEAEDEALDRGIFVHHLRLVICEPVYATPLGMDYCSEDMSDESEMPDELADAIEAFNEAVAGIVISWAPGKTALDLEDEK